MSVCSPVYLSACLSACMHVYLSVLVFLLTEEDPSFSSELNRRIGNRRGKNKVGIVVAMIVVAIYNSRGNAITIMIALIIDTV